MRYTLKLYVMGEDSLHGKSEAYLDFGQEDYTSGTLVSTALQALIPGLIGEAYQKLDKERKPEAYAEPETPKENPVRRFPLE